MELLNRLRVLRLSPLSLHLKQSLRKKNLKKWLLASSIVIVSFALGATGYFAYQNYQIRKQIAENQSTPTPIDSQSKVSPSPASKPKVTISAEEKIYINKTFNITLKYPKNWLGPEVYEYKNGFFFEVGTDTVYPYGTDRLDRIYTKENSYFITFQYTKKPESSSIKQYIESQSWINQYLPLLSIKDGESTSDAKSLLIRVKEVNINGFNGVEYISTLSETAQTEMYYGREAFLINDNYDTIRITGRPNKVTIADKQNWKADYQQVDEENLEIFRRFINSVSL